MRKLYDSKNVFILETESVLVRLSAFFDRSSRKYESRKALQDTPENLQDSN
jgi:hypothetical protein